MIRTLTALSALAAVSLATPAFADDIRVDLAGKTPAEAYAAISRAADTACSTSLTPREWLHLRASCVAETVEATLAKIGDPALVQYSQTRKGALQLASR
ncbi:MAG TPA: hypothetical protein VL460_08805 [Caulobacteraceae bacterium]|jgi:hypothetical protein|nr:hypothetical protein [Caulobacteraceae bacterium]